MQLFGQIDKLHRSFWLKARSRKKKLRLQRWGSYLPTGGEGEADFDISGIRQRYREE
jgi:hypothetical protein